METTINTPMKITDAVIYYKDGEPYFALKAQTVIDNEIITMEIPKVRMQIDNITINREYNTSIAYDTKGYPITSFIGSFNENAKLSMTLLPNEEKEYIKIETSDKKVRI